MLALRPLTTCCCADCERSSAAPYVILDNQARQTGSVYQSPDLPLLCTTGTLHTASCLALVHTTFAMLIKRGSLEVQFFTQFFSGRHGHGLCTFLSSGFTHASKFSARRYPTLLCRSPRSGPPGSSISLAHNNAMTEFTARDDRAVLRISLHAGGSRDRREYIEQGSMAVLLLISLSMPNAFRASFALRFAVSLWRRTSSGQLALRFKVHYTVHRLYEVIYNSS